MPRSATKKPMPIQDQVNEILKKAQEKGVHNNFFFTTTFERYAEQIKICNELKKAIQADGALVTKEYVKGRQNVYTNPAITEYNKTVTAANGTVATLINIIKAFANEQEGKSSFTVAMKELMSNA